jgi:hypothetical protein
MELNPDLWICSQRQRRSKYTMKHVIFYFYINAVRFWILMAANMKAVVHWKLVMYSIGTIISEKKLLLPSSGQKMSSILKTENTAAFFESLIYILYSIMPLET